MAAEEAVKAWNSWAPETTAPSIELCDQVVVCRDCSVEFVFSVAEQQFFLSKGYENGKTRCKDCTAAKKARFGEKKEKGSVEAERLQRATCAVCGETGHKAKFCSKATCFNCGKAGHQSKDCKEERKNQAGGGVCFKFQSGSCTRGATCRFAHILESS